MSYIGQGLPADTFQGFTTDSFTGDGSATTFTLSKEPFSEDTLIVVINNVIQKPTTNFTVSGTTLTIVGTAVASGDVIYAIHMGGPLPIGGAAELDLNGASDKLILDADADTTISADTDDQIDIKVGGTDVVTLTNSSLALKGTTPTLTVGDAGAEDTKIVFDGNAQDFYIGLDDSTDDLVFGKGSTLGTTQAIAIDENMDVAIGPTSNVTITNDGNEDTLTLISTDADANVGPVLNLYRNSASASDDDIIGNIKFTGNDNVGNTQTYMTLDVRAGDATNGDEDGFYKINMPIASSDVEFYRAGAFGHIFNEGGSNIDFRIESTVNTHQFFVDADGGTCHIGTTSASPGISNTTDGIAFNQNGRLFVNAAANTFSQFATDGDGNILAFASAGTGEGQISISGTTVTYGAFTGTHWSRLADNSKPTILRGTLMESLDEMCDWYQAVADVAEVKYTAEDEEVKSGSKNVGDVKEPAYKKRVPITLPNGKAVGDAVTFTFQGETHTGVYEKEADIKHVKCKISDTADSKKIYGLFSHWDPGFDYLDDDVNDMSIAQVGTFIIRVNKDVTVEAGDLLVSNGDGTAKVQDDDIIRSKTVAKVNSNIKVETYSDGSYTVPCTLHC
jgi:hypothetical protein